MRIGVDLGGTKIETLALDAQGDRAAAASGAPRRGTTTRRPCDHRRDGGGDRAPGGRRALGRAALGMPGTISPATGLVKNANSTWLNGRPFHEDLAAALGRPLRLANDANCFAISEATDGAGAGAAIVFGVILGTGVGGGIVIGGQLLGGADAIAGEWGHNPLPWPRDDERPGPACYCGRAGCIETWLSGPGLSRDHAAHGGEEMAAVDIVAAAAAGAARRRGEPGPL